MSASFTGFGLNMSWGIRLTRPFVRASGAESAQTPCAFSMTGARSCTINLMFGYSLSRSRQKPPARNNGR